MSGRILLTISMCVLALTPLEAQTLPDLSGIFSIRQQHTGRFMDAHDTANKDFGVVTRPFQPNASQKWRFIRVGNGLYKIQQGQTGLFLDAHDTQDKDFRVVMRPSQSNTTQQWIITSVGSNTYSIRHQSTGRFVDAHDTPDTDFAVVLRPAQNNATQRWIISKVTDEETTQVAPPTAGTCTIVGRVEGNLRQVACVDPACRDKQEFVLRQVSVFTRMPRQFVTTKALDGREYAFANLEVGKTYVVSPTGIGWSFDLLGAPVMCISRQIHRLNFRLKGVSTEF